MTSKLNVTTSKLHLLADTQAKIDDVISATKEDLTQIVDVTRHVESGVIQCGDARNWPVHGRERWSVVRKNFNKVYTRSPIVHLSIGHLYIEQRAWFGVQLVDSDEKGFTAKCIKAWDNPGYWSHSLYTMNLRWISIPM